MNYNCGLIFKEQYLTIAVSRAAFRIKILGHRLYPYESYYTLMLFSGILDIQSFIRLWHVLVTG